MGNGVPLTWMPIGTPLWKAGLYRNLFVFLMERSRHQARLSSAQTQTARTAKLSRNTYSMSFTRLSSRQTTTSFVERTHERGAHFYFKRHPNWWLDAKTSF